PKPGGTTSEYQRSHRNRRRNPGRQQPPDVDAARPRRVPAAAHHAAAEPGSPAAAGERRVPRTARPVQLAREPPADSRRHGRAAGVRRGAVRYRRRGAGRRDRLQHRPGRKLIMSSSFSAALSGLSANQQKLSVIGNNLANLNTVGFKASNVNFADLVSQSIGGSSANPMQIGLGVGVGQIRPTFTQGSIEKTGVATDVAIEGAGFFVIGEGNNRVYTRAGDFHFDKDGRLVTASGLPVMGYDDIDPMPGAIDTSGAPEAIYAPPGVLRQPIATTSFRMLTNLDAGAAVGETFASPVEIIDSLGLTHVATITFEKTAPNEWDYTITVPGADVTGGTPGTPFELATGTLSFDPQGRLAQVNG